jgi:glycosyltransferase involved in cell wall biosynthesis
MLSGCCIVTTSNNDADKYIEHGETGFLCDTADEMIETLKTLLADPRQAYLVGKRGREAARSFFHKDRFVEDWLTLLDDLGG